MCFNATTSLITFSISFICFVYLLYYGITKNNKYDIFASIVTILIGLMQLIEYFIWKNQDCSRINHNLSLLIMILLCSQPIIGGLLHIYLFNGKNNFIDSIFGIVCILYAFFTIYLLQFLNKMNMCSKPSVNSCRLIWAPFKALTQINNFKTLRITPDNLYKFLLFVVFFLFYFFLFTHGFGLWETLTKAELFKGYIKYPIRYAILPVTFVFALIYAINKEGIHWTDIFGSFWCFNAVIFGIVAALHI